MLTKLSGTSLLPYIKAVSTGIFLKNDRSFRTDAGNQSGEK